MIEIKDLSKTFSSASGTVEALRDINLTINDGEIFGIIGLSGAGKSTLVRCINLLERPTSGHVIIDGKDMTVLPRRELLEMRRSISMIFQGFNLLEQRSVLRNVCFPLEMSGTRAAEARRPREQGKRLSRAALRRPEAARRHRESACDEPALPPVRRGHKRARPEHHPLDT